VDQLETQQENKLCVVFSNRKISPLLKRVMGPKSILPRILIDEGFVSCDAGERDASVKALT